MKNFDVEDALEKRKLVPFSDGPKLVEKEIKTAEEDLQTAIDSFKDEKYKWATIQAYYSFFHISRALLYSKKYREKSHIQLARAIKALFVDEGQLSQDFYDKLIDALSLREMADYKGKFSKQGAEKVIKSAEFSINLVKNLLRKN